MKKRFAMLVVGGIITVSAMGLSFNNTVASAAEKEIVHPASHGAMAMQGEHKMDAMPSHDMGDMMKNCEMHKKCMEMMKNPEMQTMMQDMMKNPEMQTMMQEMMKNPEMQAKMQEMMKNHEMHTMMKETAEENK